MKRTKQHKGILLTDGLIFTIWRVIILRKCGERYVFRTCAKTNLPKIGWVPKGYIATSPIEAFILEGNKQYEAFRGMRSGRGFLHV